MAIVMAIVNVVELYVQLLQVVCLKQVAVTSRLLEAGTFL